MDMFLIINKDKDESGAMEKEAKNFVNNIHYIDRTGIKCTGGKWPIEEAERIAKIRNLDADKWEVYAALNIFYSDLCRVLNDEQIIKASIEFFFKDEDAPKNKIRIYIDAMKQ